MPSAPVWAGGGRVVNKRFYGEAHPGGPAFYTVEPPLTATSIQWSHFWWTVHTFTLVQTSLKRLLSPVPKVAVCGEVQLYTIFD